MAKINVYGLGNLGVDLSKSPIHIPDGAWRRAQNAEFPDDQGEGGLKKRGALAKINSNALSGAVSGLAHVPLNFPGTLQMLVGMNGGETESWKTTTDGANFSDIAAATLQRPATVDKMTAIIASLNAGLFYLGLRPSSYKQAVYFAGNNYNPWVSGGGGVYTAPVLVRWDGTTEVELIRIPTNPTSQAGSFPWMITDTYIFNGLIYLAVLDPGGAAPSFKGRVLAFNPSNGTLTKVGESFGNGTGEITRGMPYAMVDWMGDLWVGTNSISGSNGAMGRIAHINPVGDTQWTSDLTLDASQAGVMALAVYGDNLYAATAGGGTDYNILQRTPAGTWSESFVAPVSGNGYFGGLIVFNDELYTCFYIEGGSASTLIKKFDGSSWTTDKDVGSDIATEFAPGTPFVFNDKLYWPFFEPTTDNDLNGFLLERTTGGVWTSRLSSVGMRGVLGHIQVL